MASLPPRIGHGTLLQVESDTPGQYDTIARLTTIGELQASADDVDISNHDQAAAVREFIRGMTDPGEITGTGIWIGDNTQFAIHSDLLLGLVPNKNFRVVLPDDMGQADFSGYFGQFGLNPQMTDVIEFSFRVKISGTWTLLLPS